MSVTVRGQTKVEWRPNMTLTANSPDGTSLDADGEEHDFTATLTNIANGSPVPDRVISLNTNPVSRTGHNSRKITGADGKVTFTIADLFNEVVIYTVSLVPIPPISEPTVTDDETITWGTGALLIDLSFTDNVGGIQNVGNSAIVTATCTVSGAPVAGISVTLQTTPGGQDGDGEIKVTNISGVATWTVSESSPVVVQYDASAISPGTINSMNTDDITWI